MHKFIDDFVIKNWIWIVTSLVSIGIFIATVRYLDAATIHNTAMLTDDHERIMNIEKSFANFTEMKEDIKEIKDKRITSIEMNLVRFEKMQLDINEIKDDLKDIKKIILRPAIGLNDTNSKVNILANANSN